MLEIHNYKWETHHATCYINLEMYYKYSVVNCASLSKLVIFHVNGMISEVMCDNIVIRNNLLTIFKCGKFLYL
jgi:hypothetical protein